jgi:transposase InsO family protein
MRTDLFEYIEVWYNRERRHYALGNLAIAQFNSRKQNLKKTAYLILLILFASPECM